jgi:hypothetical protein
MRLETSLTGGLYNNTPFPESLSKSTLNLAEQTFLDFPDFPEQLSESLSHGAPPRISQRWTISVFIEFL